MISQAALIAKIGKGTPVTRRASAHLDMIRGLAALAVMLGHIRGLFYLDYRDLASHPRWISFLYALTGFGHQAVMVFFVLSGFLIGGSVLTGLNRWSWRRYLVNRGCRLYLVLVPALLMTAALDYYARQRPAAHTYFDQPIPHYSIEPIASHDTPLIFIGNLFFMQTMVVPTAGIVPTFGSNSPLWSLANEFWYYLLFPALLLVLSSPGNPKRRQSAIVMLVALLAWMPLGMLGVFPVWVMGAALHLMPQLRASRGRLWMLHMILGSNFVATLMLSRVQRIPSKLSDPAVGLAFAGWLYLLVKATMARADVAAPYNWSAKLLSRCSYSLYAVHFPMVMLIRTSAGAWLWAPTARNLAMGALISVGVFLFGLLFSRLTEAHNDRVRARILRFLSSPVGAAQTAA